MLIQIIENDRELHPGQGYLWKWVELFCHT